MARLELKDLRKLTGEEDAEAREREALERERLAIQRERLDLERRKLERDKERAKADSSENRANVHLMALALAGLISSILFALFVLLRF